MDARLKKKKVLLSVCSIRWVLTSSLRISWWSPLKHKPFSQELHSKISCLRCRLNCQILNLTVKRLSFTMDEFKTTSIPSSRSSDESRSRCAFQLFIPFLTYVSLLREQNGRLELSRHAQTKEKIDHLHMYSLCVVQCIDYGSVVHDVESVRS